MQNPNKYVVCGILGVVGVFVVAAIYGWVTYSFFCSWGNRGTFGDMFGALNAIFSGLAFVVVIIALWHQHDEFMKSEEARNVERKHAALNIYAQTMVLATQILQDEDARSARRHVFEELEGKKFDDWTKADKNNAEIVCHTFDSVAAICRCELLEWKFIITNRSYTILKAWKILEPLVKEYQRDRDPRFWSDFKTLAEKAKTI